jgi:hypothetical protein
VILCLGVAGIDAVNGPALALSTEGPAAENRGGGLCAPHRALFITSDPSGDMRTVLSDYLTSCGPRIAGLTGTAAQIAAAAKADRAYHGPHGTKDFPTAMSWTTLPSFSA